jgi:hypothetical protein
MAMSRISPVKRHCALAVSATLLLGAGGQAVAADDTQVLLLQELKKRDAVIAELLKRVEELENRVQESVVWVGSQPSGPIVMRQVDELQRQLEVLTEEQAKQGEQLAGVDPAKRPRGPGAVEVDEMAADRALERTLTSQGALLLPQGVYDIEPFFSYVRRDTEVLGIIPNVNIGTTRTRRDEFTVGANVRIGLPYETQLELGLPFRTVREERITNSFTLGQGVSDNTGSSIGDVSIGLAKTLMREDGLRPDLIGRIVWDSGTGDVEDSGVSLGSGFDEYRVSLTALKRQDPLAFVGSIGYSVTQKESVNGVDQKPGDQVSLSLGASLAASPSTSMSFTLVQSWQKETELNGTTVPGSSTNSSQFLIGASTSLGKQTLLSLTAGIGLTDDAPDYSLFMSLPIRFY